MRMSLRANVVILLVVAWPNLGCLHLPTGKPVEQTGMPETTAGAGQKYTLKPADIEQARWNEADAKEKLGKYPEAIAIYEQIQRDGGAPMILATKKLAFLYDRSNDLDRAEQEYEKLNQINPKDGETLCNLGWVWYRRGKFGIAHKFLSDSLYYQPDNPQAIANLGMTLAQQGEYDQSRETFKKVLSEAEAYSKIAFVMNLQGKRNEALRMLQTATELDPTNAQVRADLARMQISAPIAPATVVRLTTPSRQQRAAVELEEAPLLSVSNGGTSRLMSQRPTLPPLPDLDLSSENGRERAAPANNARGKN